MTARPGAFVAAVNSGGSSAAQFVSDTDYSGGGVGGATTAVINTSGLVAPAPQAVYKTERYGNTFSYTFGGLTPGVNYTVRLHFAEIYFSGAGERVFSVAINNTPVLTNFDIVATTGSENTAIIEQYPVSAPASGQIVIGFTTSVNNAKCSGIEILVSPPAAPGGLVATGTGTEVNLSWNASSGATGYNVERSGTSGGPYTTIATGVTGTNYVDTNLNTGGTYYYVVSAVNIAGQSLISNEGSATLFSCLQSWRHKYFNTYANSGCYADTADFDNDGVPNLVKFALNSNPTIPNSTKLPVFAIAGGYATLTFTEMLDATGTILYTPEWTSSLNDAWSSQGVVESVVPGSNNGVTEQVKASVPMSGPSTFLHLRVTNLTGN